MNPTQAMERMYACIEAVSLTIGTGAGKGDMVGHSMSSNYGYDLLGSGNFSAAFVHPYDRNKVVKIGFDVGDSWLGFAMYARFNEAPCFPIIESVTLTKKYYVAVMERLDKFSSEAQVFSGYRKARENFYDRDAVKEWASCLHPMAAEMFGLFGSHNTDLHSGNFMMRGGDIVIIDPYHSRKLPGYDFTDYTPRFERQRAHLIELVRMEREKLATNSTVPQVRGAQEDHALRIDAFNERLGNAGRMAGLLPQMQHLRIREALRPDFALRARTVRNKGPKPEGIAPVRFQHELRGGRADFAILDNMVGQGRDWGAAEEHLRLRMERKDREVRNAALQALDFGWAEQRIMQHHFLDPNFIHALDAEHLRKLGRRLIPQGADGGPVFKVHNTAPKPRDCRVPKRKEKHWERGNKLPRGLRYNGGHVKRNQGGGVPPISSDVRDEPRAREARPHNFALWDGKPYCGVVGRPGQGGPAAKQDLGALPETARLRGYLDKFA